MFLQQKRFVGGIALGVFLLLAASGCLGDNSSNGNTGNGSAQNQGSTPAAAITPLVITPKSSSGSPGKGPLVIASPTPVPGGKAGSQQIILGDRTLIINSAVKQKAVSTNTSLITLDLEVQNTGDKAIMNQPTFFQLIGAEGDTFGYQSNSSDTFYGPIAAHTTRTGIIVFQVPAAAATGLRLLYRPEIATETAIIPLKIS